MEAQGSPAEKTRLDVTFQEEPLTMEWCEESLELVVNHYKEISHYPDIPLKIDFETYISSYDAGLCKLYTSRLENRDLVGYACFFIRKNIHYMDSIQAVQDVIYVDPNHRGMGGRFIKYCDGRLKDLGVQVVYQHVKDAHDFGPMLIRFGYDKIETVYGKRLDK